MSRGRFDAQAAARDLLACRRIAVLGSGGAGKSTAARRLAACLQLPLHHLDRLYWLPGWQPTPDGEWVDLQRELVATDGWVIDGNYNRTLGIRLERADGVLFLDLPRGVCLWRALSRSLRQYGRVRPDVGAGCPEHLDFEFLAWIWSFPRRSRGRLLAAQAAAAPGQVWVVPGTPGEVRQLLAHLRCEAASLPEQQRV